MIWKKYPYYFLSILRLLVGFSPLRVVLAKFILPGRRTLAQVRLRSSDLKFNIRGAMDIWSLKETFLDDFYHLSGNVQKLGAVAGSNGEFLDIHEILPKDGIVMA